MFVKIVAGCFHNAAIDKEGLLYTWGDSSFGCLGHREVRNRNYPTLVSGLADKKVF
jgi:alpha-tubulin suppressor-like RCC1 family protein